MWPFISINLKRIQRCRFFVVAFKYEHNTCSASHRDYIRRTTKNQINDFKLTTNEKQKKKHLRMRYIEIDKASRFMPQVHAYTHPFTHCIYKWQQSFQRHFSKSLDITIKNGFVYLSWPINLMLSYSTHINCDIFIVFFICLSLTVRSDGKSCANETILLIK